MPYLNLSGDIFKELNDTSGLAIFVNNLGNVYFEMGDAEKALDMCEKGYEYDRQKINLEGHATGVMYRELFDSCSRDHSSRKDRSCLFNPNFLN